MNTIQRTTITSEINNLLQRHLDELSQFGIQTTLGFQEELEGITDKVTNLVKLTQLKPAHVATEEMHKANTLIHYIDSFIRAINARHIFTDPTSEIGQIYHHIRAWYNAALQHHGLPVESIWKLIEPVQPDTLNVLGGNQFEAYWWNPIPRMDIEILKRTPGIEIIEGPYVPQSAAASIGVKFTVYAVETS